MEIKEYLSGKGLDASRKPVLEGEKIERFFVEPDNFYSLKDKVPYESLDFIYSKNLINETKFFKILIKEWFYSCKTGGKIIIEMIPNRILNFDSLVKEIELLIGEKTKIIISDKEKGIIVLKKIKNALDSEDSMDKWTFGILTDTRRNEDVELEIKSIIDMKIPHFEIITCGTYRPKKNKYLKHIPFEDILPWVTRKKNLICAKAKYENLVITHNRFVFDKNWYEGMKSYGNYFEILGCVIKTPSGDRDDDWVTFGMDPSKFLNGNYDRANIGKLEYRDWDKNGYISGGFCILKKSVWRKCKWDEFRIWGQAEDVKLSQDLYKKGIVARFNKDSICNTTSKNRKVWKVIFKFNNKRFINIFDSPIKRQFKFLIRNYIIK